LKGFNDLQTVRPDIAQDWDYEKNGDVTPSDVVAGTNKRYLVEMPYLRTRMANILQ
jgi:hypothetical protein